VYLFTVQLPLSSVCKLTQVDLKIRLRFNVCREVCRSVVSKRPQIKGIFANPIQIDEFRFAGRRKYNRGRLLAGNAHSDSEDEDLRSTISGITAQGLTDRGSSDCDRGAIADISTSHVVI